MVQLIFLTVEIASSSRTDSKNRFCISCLSRSFKVCSCLCVVSFESLPYFMFLVSIYIIVHVPMVGGGFPTIYVSPTLVESKT